MPVRGMGDWSRPRESSLREERRCQKPSSTKLWNGSNWRIRPDPLSDDEEEEEEDTTEDEEAIALPPIDPRSRSILSSPPLCSLRRQRIIYYKRNTSLEEKESKNTFLPTGHLLTSHTLFSLEETADVSCWAPHVIAPTHHTRSRYGKHESEMDPDRNIYSVSDNVVR